MPLSREFYLLFRTDAAFFDLPLYFPGLSIAPKIRNNSKKLAVFRSVFGWPISGYPYLRCAIFGVIFDFELRLSGKKFHHIIDSGPEIIYVPYLVCQELSDTIYKIVTLSAHALINNKHFGEKVDFGLYFWVGFW